MRISNSKKQLAKIISENGGWREGAKFAAQGGLLGYVGFYKDKPERTSVYWTAKGTRVYKFLAGKVMPNWSNTILSRDEYFHLYPAQDADVPSGDGVTDDTAALQRILDCSRRAATIEQLAAEYRNRKDYAERKQQEADAAKEEADTKLSELVAAGKAVGLAVSVAAPEPELAITDWRDLQVGDEVECVRSPNGATCKPGMVGVVTLVDGEGVEAAFDDAMSSRTKGAWFSSEGRCFRFIRRPAKGDANA